MKPPAIALQLLESHRRARVPPTLLQPAEPRPLDLPTSSVISASSDPVRSVPVSEIVTRIMELKQCYARLVRQLADASAKEDESDESISSSDDDVDGDNNNAEEELLAEGGERSNLSGEEESPRRKKARIECPGTQNKISHKSSSRKKQQTETVLRLMEELHRTVCEIQHGIRSKLGQCVRAEMIRDLQRETEERGKAIQRMSAALDVANNLV